MFLPLQPHFPQIVVKHLYLPTHHGWGSSTYINLNCLVLSDDSLVHITPCLTLFRFPSAFCKSEGRAFICLSEGLDLRISFQKDFLLTLPISSLLILLGGYSLMLTLGFSFLGYLSPLPFTHLYFSFPKFVAVISSSLCPFGFVS